MVFRNVGSVSSTWASKTYSEIQTVAEQDGSILLVPVGSTEQHGYHLPVATDTILVNEIAQLGARRVEDELPVLVTPPFWPGYSPHHMAFGGTITLEFDVMLESLENIADSALSNGFDAILLLNGHGGNMPLISAATSMIGNDHADVEVLGLTYFELATAFIDDIRDSDVGGMAHGGEFETSLMLYLRPALVKEDQFQATPLEEPYDLGNRDLLEGGPLHVYRGFEEYSASGAIGAPELASAEKGENLYRRLGDEIESLLWQVHEEALPDRS